MSVYNYRGRLRAVSLYSGSRGNSTLITTPDGSILIDAGKSARALCAALTEVGSDISEIKAIFITHEHTDHVSALETLSKKYHIPVHAAQPTAARLCTSRNSAVSDVLITHTPHYTERFGGLTVRSFCLSHDSAFCVGYRADYTDVDGTVSFGVATDTGYVTPDMDESLEGCDAVLLESNHNEQMLMSGPYPQELKRRILSKSGHLSNHDCGEFIEKLQVNGTKYIMLGHLSEENNTPERALSDIRELFTDDDGLCLEVARQDCCREIFRC